MRRQMIENAALEVANQVRAVEDSIDATLADMAELQSRMMRVNAVASVGPAAIHPALQELSAALSTLLSARAAIVNCHSELASARTKVPGLRTVSWGDDDTCPPAAAKADLRIVA